MFFVFDYCFESDFKKEDKIQPSFFVAKAGTTSNNKFRDFAT